MSLPPSSSIPTPKQGISLVDRINLFFHYRRYIKMIARRWFLLAGAILLCAGYQTYRAVKEPNKYQAYSKIEVAPKLANTGQPKAIFIEELNSFYEKQIAYLKSSMVLGAAAKKASIQTNPLLPPPAPMSLTEAVRDKSGVITVYAISTDIESAKRFVTLWAREFLEFKDAQTGTSIKDSLAAATKDESKALTSLKDVQARKAEFQREYNIADLDVIRRGEQVRYDTLFRDLADKRTTRQRLENRKAEDLAIDILPDSTRLDVKGDKSTQIDPLEKFAADSQYPKLRAELSANEDEIKGLTNLLEGHPLMVQLKETNRRLDRDIKNILKQLGEKREARIQSLKDDERNLETSLKEQNDKMLNSSRLVTTYKQLEDEEIRYKNELEKARNSIGLLTQNAIDKTEFKLIETGIGSNSPVGPNRSRMVMMGLLFGIALGVGLIYFLDRLDDRLELAEDIEAKLQHPVLGQIPQVAAGATKGQPLILTKLEEHNVFSESVRGVRSAVMLGAANNPKNVLLVTSAVPADGKTTFTVNFAVTLAIANHRVLLVDADLRRGNTHNFFQNNRGPGFSEILLGESHWTDVLRNTEIDTLKVIHSGRLPSNPGELLISPITKEFLNEVLEEYDYVVFDCPPLTAIDDTFTLLPLSTGLIFVVRSGQTSMRFAKNALVALRQRGAKILGLVVNGITPDNPYYYYQHYYHSYYTRGLPENGDVRTSPMPGAKMAQPKRAPSPGRIRSIEAEAHGVSSTNSLNQLASKEREKAALYKSRRQSTYKPAQNPSPSNIPATEAHHPAPPHPPASQA